MEGKIDEQAKAISKQIKNLIQDGFYEEAIKLTETYPDDKVIQSQAITAYMKLGMNDKAEEIAEREEFQDKKEIYSQRITIALVDEDAEKAKILLKNAESKEDFLSPKVTKGFKKAIKALEKRLRHKDRQIKEKNEIRKKEFMKEIATKIYSGKITQLDIAQINGMDFLSDYDKTCIKLAICEKQGNREQARELFKTFNQTEHTRSEFKIINSIMQRINSNRKQIFDYGWYGKNVGLVVDMEFSSKINSEEKPEESRKKTFREELKVDTNQSTVVGTKTRAIQSKKEVDKRTGEQK